MARNNTQQVKKVSDIWTRWTNPLRSLSQAEIDRLLENARLGNDIRL